MGCAELAPLYIAARRAVAISGKSGGKPHAVHTLRALLSREGGDARWVDLVRWPRNNLSTRSRLFQSAILDRQSFSASDRGEF
jgi:hypothetical protein